jgi:hypothetical protein
MVYPDPTQPVKVALVLDPLRVMHIPGDGWSADAPGGEIQENLPCPSFGVLPRGQKCELATLAAAAVMSTGLFMMPLMPSSRLESFQVDVRLSPALPLPTQMPLPRPIVLVSTRRTAEPSALRRSAPPRPVRIARAVEAEGDRGRLARFFLGDGRYRIQPFPTPDAAPGSR